MKKVRLLLIFAFCISVVYCVAQVVPSQESGNIIKEIALSEFEKVVVKGGGNFYLHYSPDTKVKIKGASTCVENTKVSLSSNTLRISPAGDLSEQCRVEVHIFTSNFKEIQQDGGGEIVINGGFAPVAIFKCRVNGGGRIEMTALKVGSLLASMDGRGEISAQVSTKISARIKGGGVLFYKGEPIIESDISGGGAIKRK